jgi:hypothetical protein
MEDKNQPLETPIQRLVKLLELNNISHYSFQTTVGVANGYINNQLKGKGAIGTDILEKIHKAYPDWDILWIVLGLQETANTPSATKKHNYLSSTGTSEKPSATKKNYAKIPTITLPADAKPSDMKGVFYIKRTGDKPSDYKNSQLVHITPIDKPQDAGYNDDGSADSTSGVRLLLSNLADTIENLQKEVRELKKGGKK